LSPIADAGILFVEYCKAFIGESKTDVSVPRGVIALAMLNYLSEQIKGGEK